jgi:AcrR family transcriptional regulator
VVPAKSSASALERPRVEGDREGEILDATVRLLVETGYDKLTLDAVAAAAHASKATLYRRWNDKAELVVDAVSRAAACPALTLPDTGDLRADLLGFACGPGGLTDVVPLAVVAGLLTAMHRDPALAAAFRDRFIAPRRAGVAAVFERAKERGEIAPDVPTDLLVDVLPALALQRAWLLGEPVSPDLVTRVVDEVVLPAARGPRPTS